jgi:SAM-dependent methyltransferase
MAEPDAHLARIVDFYTVAEDEDGRLDTPIGRLEWARLTEILARRLAPASRILDVGGGPGRLAAHLADVGHTVHLVDPVPRHIELARARAATRPTMTVELGTAHDLPTSVQESVDAVLLFGPLYHLPHRADRIVVLDATHAVLRPGGQAFVIAINRFAGVLDSVRGAYIDTGFGAIAAFHRPPELAAELADSRFGGADAILGLEGPAWLLDDLGPRWDDHAARRRFLEAARAVETEPSLLGLSPHLLAIARRRP